MKENVISTLALETMYSPVEPAKEEQFRLLVRVVVEMDFAAPVVEQELLNSIIEKKSTYTS